MYLNSPPLFFYFDFFKGIYGTKGTGTTSTTPSGQYGANSWTAADGTLLALWWLWA
jgi:hypothetical protein